VVVSLNAHSGAASLTGPTPAVAHVIAITSGKGGVGKTCLSTNLSIALSQQGQRVCVFDADTSLANVNILLDIRPEFTLEHYVSNGKAMEDILVPAPGGIDIIPGATGITSLLEMGIDQQTRLLSGLRVLESKYDYLIIDTSAGVDESLLKFLAAAPSILLTITHEPTSLTDAFSLLKVMKSKGIDKPVYVVVNMAQSRKIAHGTFKRFKGAVSKYLKLNVYYIGFVYFDRVVTESITRQHPFVLGSKASLASRCIKEIANRLVQVVSQTGHTGGEFSGFFQQLRMRNRAERQLEEEKSRQALTAQAVGQDKMLETLLAQSSREESAEFLKQSVTAWVEQYQRFPESIRDALTRYVADTESLSGQPNMVESKGQSEGGCQQNGQAALIAACQIAAKLAEIEAGDR